MAAPTPDDPVPLAVATDRLLAAAAPVDRTDRVPLSVAIGRTLARDVVRDDETLLPAGRRIRPADAGHLRAAGVVDVTVRQRPEVGVVPTGDDLVEGKPGPGERVETAGFTLSQYVDRWGGKVTYRSPVSEDAPALRMAVQRDLTRDALAVVGTEPGDTVRSVVGALGELRHDRTAIEPGTDTGVAVVHDRPVLLLPPDPVAARVAAIELLRPLLRAFLGEPTLPHPSFAGDLAAPVETDPERHSFVPVAVEGDEPVGTVGEETEADRPTVRPLGAWDRETATRADGRIAVPVGRGTVPAGTTVAVSDPDYLP